MKSDLTVHVDSEPLRKLIDSDWFALNGQYHVEHYKPSLINPGEFDLVNIYAGPNGITNVGKNTILNTMFNDLTAIANASWFIGLIDNFGFTTLSAGDTMSSHSGWAEFHAGYSQSTRVAWGSGTSTAQSTSNSVPATFDIIGSAATVYGIFVVSNSTKNGTSGVLWSTAGFSSPVPISSGDQLKVSYSVSC